MKLTIKLHQLMLFLASCAVINEAKFVGNVKDSDDGGTITILDIQDDNKTQYLNQNFEQGNYNYGYDIKPSGPVGQFHHEHKSPENVVYGCYGYEAPDNKNHMTFYISDSWGYRPVRQEMDTEIFYPADNPGGGHKKGTMTRWADLVFPEMCAHFAERIASSTNLVTKAPFQVATPPASFTPNKFEATSQTNTAQPTSGLPTPSILSNNFGSKNTPSPSGGFDIVQVNTPIHPGILSPPFSRITSVDTGNPAGTRHPSGSDLTPFLNSNLPSEQRPTLSNSNNVTPNRLNSPSGGAPTNNIPTVPSGVTPIGGRQPSGNPTTGLRTTALPSIGSTPAASSQTEGSNTGPILPNGGTSRTPQVGFVSNHPDSETNLSREPTRTPSTNLPTTSNSRPIQSSFRPSPTGPVSTDQNTPTDTTNVSGKLGQSSGSNEPFRNQHSSTNRHTNGPYFGDKETPSVQGPTGNTGDQTTPFGRPTPSSRLPLNRSPFTTARPFTSVSSNIPSQGSGVTGIHPSRTTDGFTPSNLSHGQGSNSGLVSPTPLGSFDRNVEGPSGTTQFSNGTPTQTPSRLTVNRRPSNPYQNTDDNDNLPNIPSSTSGNRSQDISHQPSSSSHPTGAGAIRTTPTTGLNRGTNTHLNSRPTSSFSVANPDTPALQTSSFSSPRHPSTNQPSTETFVSQNFNTPDSDNNNRITGSQRPTNVPSSSRFPTAGFSGNFNNPSTLQPSSTNQQNTVPSGNHQGQLDKGRQTTIFNNPTGPSSSFTAERPGSRLPSPLTNTNAPRIPQEPEIDNTVPHLSTQPSSPFTSGVPTSSQNRISTNPAAGTTRETQVTGQPSTNPTFGNRTPFTPTVKPSTSPFRGPTPSSNGLPRPLTGSGLRNDNETDNELFCASQCSSCKGTQSDSSTPPPPLDEDFLNIPGAFLSQVPIIYYPDCSGNGYVRPAIVPFCPSSQASQCNNDGLQRRSPLLTTTFPDSSNFVVGHDTVGSRTVRKVGTRVARKVRRGGQHQSQQRLLNI